MKIPKIAALWPLFVVLAAVLSVGHSGPTQASESASADRSSLGYGSTTYKYEGNLISRKFHQPNCPYSLAMAHSRKIKFDTKKQAVAEGYRPCRFCLAVSTRTVQAKLINIDISR